MNAMWEQFLAESILSDEDGEDAKVGEAQPPGTWRPQSSEFTARFPAMDRLLRTAFVSTVEMHGNKYQLFTWERSDGQISGWLCPLPPSSPGALLFDDHQLLLKSFAGIVEQAGTPESSWIISHDDVLTQKAAERTASVIKDYEWAFKGSPIPIVLDDFYAIAIEANGNTTLCHRTTGEVVLFAPDHSFDYVVSYPGCPEYTLYHFQGAKDFRSWVNCVATQWA